MAKDPMAAVRQMAPNNEQMQKVQQVIDQNGSGNPQQAFYALAQQMGVDPNNVLSQARSYISK